MTKTIDSARRQMRNDFMKGHGKAGAKDNLERQRPGLRSILSEFEIKEMYASNQILQNIIDIPAEDLTRSWFTLKMKDEQLKNKIMDKLRSLKARESFQDRRVYERLSGDGLISVGVTQSNPFNLSDPLDMSKVKSVDYIHAFSGWKVNEWLINEDMFSQAYGQIEYFKLKRMRQAEQGQNISLLEDNRVHHSRLLHDQTRRIEGERQGMPLLVSLYDSIKVLDTSLWSVGQILYDFTFKVYKSEDIEDMSVEEKNELQMLLDYMFRTEALALIGKNEELDRKTTNVSGIKDLLDFVWDYIAGAARMPKSVIKGQESGTITGAQYDVMNYYSRVAAQQENELRPHIEQLIRLIIASEEMGGVDPESVEFDIKFNPLWEVDAKTDAEIRKINAESDAIYIKNGVLLADEVRESRYGHLGVTSNIEYSGDEADINRMAAEIYQKHKEDRGKRGQGDE